MAACMFRNSLVSWSRNPVLGLNVRRKALFDKISAQRSSLFRFKVCPAQSFTCLTGFKSPCIRSVQYLPLCNRKSVSSINTSLQVCASQSGSIFGLLKNKLRQNVIPKPLFGISGARFLPTLNQYRRGKAKTKKDTPKKIIPRKKRILLGPQRKGVCVKVFTRKPKKPNSGNRKCALLKLNDGRLITAYIPGEGAVLQEHGVVLFEGGRVQDCPGIKYKIIRRKYDMN